jgi:hypothetical protein
MRLLMKDSLLLCPCHFGIFLDFVVHRQHPKTMIAGLWAEECSGVRREDQRLHVISCLFDLSASNVGEFAP